MEIKRGEIYMISLDPVFGREMGGFKLRPVVVISIDDLHRQTQLVTVVPGTSNAKKIFSNTVLVKPHDRNGLEFPTLFQCNQIRAVSSGRFTQRRIGLLSRSDIESIESSIAFCIGLKLDLSDR
jgi:mRNA-degrading endonuclease toxin of MazEF toxin-antitoxin module